MTSKHFACDLCIARLICAYQSEHSELIEKEKYADAREQDDVSAQPEIHAVTSFEKTETRPFELL